jgi:hypothetical protein
MMSTSVVCSAASGGNAFSRGRCAGASTGQPAGARRTCPGSSCTSPRCSLQRTGAGAPRPPWRHRGPAHPGQNGCLWGRGAAAVRACSAPGRGVAGAAVEGRSLAVGPPYMTRRLAARAPLNSLTQAPSKACLMREVAGSHLRGRGTLFSLINKPPNTMDTWGGGWGVGVGWSWQRGVWSSIACWNNPVGVPHAQAAAPGRRRARWPALPLCWGRLRRRQGRVPADG